MSAAARWGGIALTIVAIAAPDARAQPVHAHGAALQSIPLELLERPVPIRQGIGVAHERVTTTSARAQAYYDQGLSCLHSYVWIDAARSFHEALRLDPALAMAYVGLSNAFDGLGASQAARDASDRARALSATAGPRDQVRIALRAEQLAAARGGEAPRSAYTAAVDRALVTFPNDVELLILRGQAEEASGSNPGMAAGAGAIAFFERALAAAPNYFAPHHYLIHAYENVNRIDSAVQHGKAYVRLAPAVPHAHHMYAHGLRRAGRTKEAIVEFRNAYELEAAWLTAGHIPPEYDWHQHHNLDLLGTSYQYLGQMKNAERVLRQSFDLPSTLVSEEMNKRAYPAFLVARGEAREAATVASVLIARGSPLVRAVGHIAAAKAQMTLGQMSVAADHINAALRELRAGGPDAGELAPDFRLLQGEFFLRGGDRDKGRPMLRAAVAELRAQPGPDAWTQTLLCLEAVARAAREVGDWTLASELAEQMRQHDPAYAGAHYALGLAAERRGDRAAARRAFTESVARWRDADPDLPALVDARKRLESVK